MLRPLTILVVGVACTISLVATAGFAQVQNPVMPRRIEVMPVFFVPRGQPVPTEDQAERLLHHLRWAQKRYRELLHNEATFAQTAGKPHIYHATYELPHYQAGYKQNAACYLAEILQSLHTDRYRCPYSFAIIISPQDRDPTGVGGVINGGLNTGGGFLYVTSHELDQSPNFQSTLQHELGHSFGLPHIYDYS